MDEDRVNARELTAGMECGREDGDLPTVGGGCSHSGKVTVLSAAFHAGGEFAGVNAIFIHIRPSGNFAAQTRIPSSRAAGAYHVGARCGGGSFGNITLHVT